MPKLQKNELTFYKGDSEDSNEELKQRSSETEGTTSYLKALEELNALTFE